MSLKNIENARPPMPEKVSFAQIVKSPVTYALLVVSSILWIFIFLVVRANDSNLKARDEELKRLRLDNAEVRASLAECNDIKEDIYRALLFQQGINLQISSKLDSINQKKR